MESTRKKAQWKMAMSGAGQQKVFAKHGYKTKHGA
jgi:hypothetical protein